jgi:hypothetical protein
MKVRQWLPQSYTLSLAYCLVAAIFIMYLGGPISIQGSVAELKIGEGARSDITIKESERIILISGHRFFCDWKWNQEVSTRCKTRLKGKPLEVEFMLELPADAPGGVIFCHLQYDGQLLNCGAFKDYRHKKGQVDLSVENSLGLTQSDRFWLMLTNPLANIFGNITEIDWDKITPILTMSISILAGIAIGLDLMQFSETRSILPYFKVFLAIPIALLLQPAVLSFVNLVLILTGHAD